jgi:hypothetical protein
MLVQRNYILSQKPINTYPCSDSNRITKEYYNLLIGAINRGEIYKSVCKVTNKTFATETYYLISNN